MMNNNLTAVEVIGLAISSEEDAAEFYGKLSKKIKNDLVRAKFESLAKEEIGHRAILVSLYKKMTCSDKEPPRVPGQPETAEGGWAPLDVENLEELLKLAIAREHEASNFYKGAARNATDVSGKRTLEYLAGIEHGHEVALKMELEAYQRDENWYSDNPDIQLV